MTLYIYETPTTETTMIDTILAYPTAVEIPAEPFGWRAVSWAAFSAANPDVADDVAMQIAVYGVARVGGGAAPLITIRRAS